MAFVATRFSRVLLLLAFGCGPAPLPPLVPQAAELPSLRFVDGGAPNGGVRGKDLGSVNLGAVTAGELTVSGPVAWLETTVVLQGRKASQAIGQLELVLPFTTFANEATFGGGPGEPLREQSLRTSDRGRTFRTAPITLEAGQTHTVTLRHAFLLDVADKTLALPFLGETSPQAPALQTARSSLGAFELERLPAPERLPFDPARVDSKISGAILLLDLSAVRARDMALQLRTLKGIADKLGREHLIVAACDEQVSVLFDGAADQLNGEAAEALLARGTLGRSNTPKALRFALEHPARDASRVMLVTDGNDAFPFGSVALANPMKRSVTLFVPPGRSNLRELDALTNGLTDSTVKAVPLTSASEEETLAYALYERRMSEQTSVLWPFQTSGGVAVASPVLVSRKAQTAATTSPEGPAQAPAFILRALADAQPNVDLNARFASLKLLEQKRPFPTSEELRPIVDPMAGLPPDAAPTAPAQATPKVIEKPAIPATKEPPKEELPTVEGEDEGPARIPPETIQWIVRKNFGRFRGCYRDSLRRNPKAGGRLLIRFDIDPQGAVPLARAISANVGDFELVACVVRSFESLSFPALANGATVEYPLVLAASKDGAEPEAARAIKPRTLVPELEPGMVMLEPWQNAVKEVHEATDRGDHAAAISRARALLASDPADPMGYVLVGDACAKAGDASCAERAYASLTELDGASLPLQVALRLISLRTTAGIALAKQLVQAEAERPEPSPEALRLFALLTAAEGDVLTALTLIDNVLARPLDATKYPGIRDLLRSDLSVLTAMAITAHPENRLSLRSWAADVGVVPSERAVTTLSASWYGSSDMDLSVRDIGFNGANKNAPALASGGRILADVTASQGPEAFVVENPESHPYSIGVKAKLARSFGFGSVLVLEHDGAATLRLHAHPFDINVDGGSADVLRLVEPICKKTPCAPAAKKP
jgi:hypothetical protein